MKCKLSKVILVALFKKTNFILIFKVKNFCIHDIPYLFLSACSGNMYGANCTVKCGMCLDNEQCQHVNGTCMKGCDKGFHGSSCIEGYSM